MDDRHQALNRQVHIAQGGICLVKALFLVFLARVCLDHTRTADILLYHGKLDNATPYLQAVEFAEFVREKTGDPERARYKLIEDTGHSGGGYLEGWMAEEKLAFLRKYL